LRLREKLTRPGRKLCFSKRHSRRWGTCSKSGAVLSPQWRGGRRRTGAELR